MKNILVPTDFSPNAENALKYAINIAIQFDSKIHLIHVYEVVIHTGMLVSMRDFLKKEAEEQLAKVVEENKERFLHGSSLIAKAIEGNAKHIISRYARHINADLIVMGTQGASGLKEVFIGSNTVSVINKSKVPVLAVPNHFAYQPIETITLALDTRVINNKEVVSPLIQLAKKYKAHVNLLHVEKTQTEKEIDEGVLVFLTDIPHSFHVVHDPEIKHGIEGFVTKTKTDLLCLIHRDRGFLGNLFHKSVVRKEAFSNQVPLLALTDEF